VSAKKAVGRWKHFQERRPTDAELQALFAQPCVTGLAVILGSASGGLVCRDFDVADAYHRWTKDHPDLARILPTVQTYRGHHIYFTGEEGFENLDDGEYRGDSGHYCLLPPSRHPTGMVYQWLIHPPKEGPLPTVNRSLLSLPPTHPLPPNTHSLHALELCPTDELEIKTRVEAAIVAALPTAEGQRNRCVFELARRLKAIDGLDESPKSLRAIVMTWHQQALSVIGSKSFGETWADFAVSWRRVRTPITMGAVLEAARTMPTPAAALVYHDDPPMQLLVAVCAVLQSQHGKQPFFLSARQAAETIGVSRMDAWRRLQVLPLDGVIELVRRYGPEERLADEYRCKGTE
jgi:hypothetical protein